VFDVEDCVVADEEEHAASASAATTAVKTNVKGARRRWLVARSIVRP
jgi:hypothetical protein